jgi:hypothetical protein
MTRRHLEAVNRGTDIQLIRLPEGGARRPEGIEDARSAD